ncbi:hypothetical protein [Flammeovirga aprica]|uniref:Uncharacterized protein n=1 Tax=Flammeovirga aprica JL-4 TaxID=694437 RepID=A0A7X9RV04_9BACT|nr:hypothetical protein [Flammeovirga aprica]NME69212.1 hypothetical protein [Flammeovirga aprica JL-4]
MFDFLLPRETTTSYVYGHQTLEHGGNDVLMWSDNTASFVIDMGDSAYVLTDAEMFVFRTRILKRIDPIVLLNEDMIFPVVYNIRTSYFIMPIILILLCLFLIFNTLDKHEDGLIDPFCFLFILIMCFVNFALYFNPFLQFYTGKLE